MVPPTAGFSSLVVMVVVVIVAVVVVARDDGFCPKAPISFSISFVVVKS